VTTRGLHERRFRSSPRSGRVILGSDQEGARAAYAIFTREKLRDPRGIDAYNSKAGPSLDGHPVHVLAAYGGIHTLEGAPAEGVVLLEFPTLAAARA